MLDDWKFDNNQIPMSSYHDKQDLLLEVEKLILTNTNLTMKVLHVLPIGIINITTGKTMYEWSIYDWPECAVYLTSRGSLLYCQPGTFEIGDEIELRGNDSDRFLHKDSIVDFSICKKEEVLVMLKRNDYDYYPIKAFKARASNNRKLRTSYSVK